MRRSTGREGTRPLRAIVARMTPGMRHFDRQGEPIPLERWTELWGDNSYRFVERTWIHEGVVEVVTTWEGVQFDDGPPELFRVAELRWKSGEIQAVNEEEMDATEADAKARHAALVIALRSTSKG